MLPDNQHRFRMILGHPKSFRIGHLESLFRIGHLELFQIGHLEPFQINHLGSIQMKSNKIRPNYWKLVRAGRWWSWLLSYSGHIIKLGWAVEMLRNYTNPPIVCCLHHTNHTQSIIMILIIFWIPQFLPLSIVITVRIAEEWSGNKIKGIKILGDSDELSMTKLWNSSPFYCPLQIGKFVYLKMQFHWNYDWW